MEIEGRVGIAWAGAGVEDEFRMGRSLEMMVSDAFPHFADMNYNGFLFAATTAVAGVTVAAGGAVTNPAFAIYNPQGSGKIIIPTKARYASISGTPGVGHVGYYLSASQTAGSGTANITPVSLNTGNASGSKALCYGAVTNALSAAGTFTGPMLNILSATTVPVVLTELLDGEFILFPGMALSINPGATGTTNVVAIALTFLEIPQNPA